MPPIDLPQMMTWNAEADALWAQRIKSGSERPHPSVEFHAKLAFRRGYIAAMAKVQREKASGS